MNMFKEKECCFDVRSYDTNEEANNLLISNRLILVILVTCVFFHIVLFFKYFPMSSVIDNPLSSDDLRFHYASAIEGHSFFSKGLRISGYSPNYMAGYPFGLWGSMSRRGYEITSVLFGPLPFNVAYYSLLFLLVLITPMLIAVAFKILGFSWGETAVCCILSILVFQMDSSFFWQRGSIMFPFVTALAAVYSALLQKGYKFRNLFYCILAGICLGAVVWIHQLVFVVVFSSTALFLFLNRKNILTKFNWIFPLIVFTIGFLVILPWFIDLVKFVDLRMPVQTGVYQAGIKDLIMDVFTDRRFRYPYDRRSLTHVVWVMALLGAIMGSSKYRSRVRLFAYSSLMLFVITYTFSYSGFLKQLEPYHYLQSCIMFAIIPATVGLFKLISLCKKTTKEGGIIIFCLLLIIMPTITAYLIDIPAVKSMTGLNAQQKKTLDFFKNTKDTIKGRILCQDEVLAGALQYMTNKELIGGTLSSWALMPHRFTNVTENTAFSQEIGNITAGSLDNYLSLYNVEYIVSVTEDFARKIEDIGEIYKEIAEFDGIKIFKLDVNRLSWILSMPSDVKIFAEPDKIVIENPPRGDFVLKYHYLRTLSSNDDIGIKPVNVLNDPVAFIGVENPKALDRIVLKNK